MPGSDHFTAVWNMLPAGVLVIDQNGVVIEHNPAASHLLGEPLVDERWLDIIARAFSPKPTDGHEISLTDGRLVSVATSALESEPGQVIMLTDMTETRALQNHMGHLHRLSEMGRMMASLAHQIRTPLSAALLYASHLKKGELSDERAHKYATKLISRLHHIEAQIADMLIFARGEEPTAAPFTVKTLIDHVCENVSKCTDVQNINFSSHNECPSLEILGNEHAVASACQNLIVNAVEARNTEINIELIAKSNADNIMVVVRDNGRGIPTSDVNKVAEPFYTTKTHGTGLGLSVVKACVEAHGGGFSLDSTEGRGTEVTLTFPILKS